MKVCAVCEKTIGELEPVGVEGVCGPVCIWCKFDFDNPPSPRDWAETLVQTSAWMHIDFSPACTGWTMASSGRARCGACEWECSGRMSDAGEIRSAVFSQLALATIGGIVAGADRLLQAEADAINKAGDLVRAEVAGHELKITFLRIHQIAFTHTVKV